MRYLNQEQMETLNEEINVLFTEELKKTKTMTNEKISNEPNPVCLIGELDKSGKLVFTWATNEYLDKENICLVGFLDEDGTVRLKWYSS